MTTFLNKATNLIIALEGDVIQQTEQRKLKLDEDENTRYEKMMHRKSTPVKIKGKLREDIAAEIRKNELSMSAVSAKFSVNKHAVIQIRRQELGR